MPGLLEGIGKLSRRPLQGLGEGFMCFARLFGTAVIYFPALLAACMPALAYGDSPAQAKAAADKAKPSSANILPAPLSGFSDGGAFQLYLHEEKLATMNFAWKPDGSFESDSTVSLAGQSIKQGLKIVPDKDGRWLTISIKSPRGDIMLQREGAVVRRTDKKKTETINLKANAVLFDNFSPALISQSLRSYDRTKGGKQKLQLFVLPGVMIEETVERKKDIERTVAGQDLKLTEFACGLTGVDLSVWADSQGKVYLADVPAQHAAYIREGFEILRQAPETDPLVSKAVCKFKCERNVQVPMRDGIKLATNIYRPEGIDRAPVVLIRTPYKKEMSEIQGAFFARRGYAVAIQDCRGRFASAGTWEPFFHEPADGYDTIEWLAAQPWCTGKVGMIGGSYLGWVQWWAASQQPPHLTTMIPNVAPPDPFYNLPYEYGVYFLWAAIWWADVLESGATADLSGAAFEKISDKKYQKLLKALPVIELDKAVLGKENRYWREWIQHPVNDEYWSRANFLDRLHEVRIPVFHQSGWFDGDGIGSKLNYLRMASFQHPYQKLTLGPWGHTDRATRQHEGRDFGPAAIIDLQRDYLRWLDYWLKGIDNGISREPLVSLFVMGSNRWVHGDVYPLPQTQFQKWYLSSAGKANTSHGAGLLVTEPPADNAPVDEYTYEPGDPTPDPKFYEEPDDPDGSDAKKVKSIEEKKKIQEAHHEAVTAARRDILVYVSKPFEKAYTFAGPVSAVLYASSSAKDTDWFVRLIEVDEKGHLFPLVEGKIRARFRESTKAPSLLEPGKIYPYTIDLWQTGVTIPPGRRLRVEVASASFPFFSRNLNTGGHNETETQYVTAKQTIYHSKEFPSHILLPALPEINNKKP
jgi:putative CocE/NonD family hydrolase